MKNKKILIAGITIILCLGLGYFFIKQNNTKKEITAKTNQINQLAQDFEKKETREEKLKILQNFISTKDELLGNQNVSTKVLPTYNDQLTKMKTYFTNEYDQMLKDNTIETVDESTKEDLTKAKDNLNKLLETLKSDSILTEDEIKERVYNTLKICGLYEFRNWPISALSFGQKKRVTIASILVLNPEVIILDEPTAGQDFKHYTEIMEFLRELNKNGVTIVMITHDMHLMLEYTNRAIVLSNGQKLAEDTAANILTNENIIKEANLKETSLYSLAVKCGIDDPREFVRRFINYDRRIRGI